MKRRYTQEPEIPPAGNTVGKIFMSLIPVFMGVACMLDPDTGLVASVCWTVWTMSWGVLTFRLFYRLLVILYMKGEADLVILLKNGFIFFSVAVTFLSLCRYANYCDSLGDTYSIPIVIFVLAWGALWFLAYFCPDDNDPSWGIVGMPFLMMISSLTPDSIALIVAVPLSFGLIAVAPYGLAMWGAGKIGDL